MDVKVISKSENAALSRTEISATVEILGQPTPKKDDLVKSIAASEKAKEDAVVVKEINPTFGLGKASFKAFVYKSKEDKEKIEPKSGKPAEGEKAEGDAPAESAPAEAPKEEAAEEKKEEAPAEEKPAEEEKKE